jgi:predicted dehydrogenase
MTIKVGVVGLGYGQRVLIPAFRATGRCDIAAVCGGSLDRAKEVAHHLKVPKAYGDWWELVHDPEIEAVVIATPPALQPSIVKAAAEARKPVFCEKPLATSRAAAADVLAVVQQAGIANMIDFELSMIQAWQRAKTILNSKMLGRVRHAVISWQFETYTNRVGRDTWKTRVEDGGGVLNLFVSHTFHDVEWLLGPVQRVSAGLFHDEPLSEAPKNETTVILCAVLENGTPVSVTVSNNAFLGGGHRLEVYGDQGSLVLENTQVSYVRGFRLWLGRRHEDRLLEMAVPEEPAIPGDDRIGPASRLAERFLAWIERGIPSSPTMEDGYRVQCVLEAVRASARMRQWVEVTEEPALRESA